MESGHPVQGDILTVIPRRTPSGAPPPDGAGGGTWSRRIVLLPARRQKLSRIVFAALGACGLILVAAVVIHLLRPKEDATLAAPPAAITPAVPAPATASPPAAAAAAAPVPDAPQTGTLHLQRPAAPGKVWLDGQKLTTASSTVRCGDHQLKVGRGKAHSVTIPCGGDLKISH